MTFVQNYWTSLYNWVGNECQFYILVGVLVPVGTFWIFNTFLALLYHFEFKFFEKYRIQKKAFPSKEQIRKATIYGFFLHCTQIGVGVFSYLNYKRTGGPEIAILPDWWIVVRDVLISMIIEDSLFYWTHRICHHHLIYKHIHKQHHEFKSNIGVCSVYAHPGETFFTTYSPTLAGPTLLRSHIFTLMIWLFIRITETIDAHSGYEFPWSPYKLIPFQGGAGRHDYHHSKNVGDYGSFFVFWDRLCGTNRFDQFVQEQLKNSTETHRD